MKIIKVDSNIPLTCIRYVFTVGRARGVNKSIFVNRIYTRTSSVTAAEQSANNRGGKCLSMTVYIKIYIHIKKIKSESLHV